MTILANNLDVVGIFVRPTKFFKGAVENRSASTIVEKKVTSVIRTVVVDVIELENG
jgi:hypothetical protein